MRGLSWIAGVTAAPLSPAARAIIREQGLGGCCPAGRSGWPPGGSSPSRSSAEGRLRSLRGLRLTTAPGMHARSDCLKSDVTAAEFLCRSCIPEAFPSSSTTRPWKRRSGSIAGPATSTESTSTPAIPRGCSEEDSAPHGTHSLPRRGSGPRVRAGAVVHRARGHDLPDWFHGSDQRTVERWDSWDLTGEEHDRKPLGRRADLALFKGGRLDSTWSVDCRAEWSLKEARHSGVRGQAE